jgi:hypothetical protein
VERVERIDVGMVQDEHIIPPRFGRSAYPVPRLNNNG